MYVVHNIHCRLLVCLFALSSIFQINVFGNWVIHVTNNTGSTQIVTFYASGDFTQDVGVGTGYSTKTYGDSMAGRTVVISDSGGGYFLANVPSNQNDYECSYTVNGGNQSPGQWYGIHFGITNNSSSGWKYSYNTPQGTTNYVYVPPGGVGNIDITTTNPYAITFNRTDYDGDGNAINNSIKTIASNDSNWVGGQTNRTGTVDNRVPPIDTGNSNPTNQNIGWSDSAGWALDTTVKTGFSSERQTLANGFGDLGNRLGIANGLLQVLAANSSGYLLIDGHLVEVKSVLNALRGDVQSQTAVIQQINGVVVGVSSNTAVIAANTSQLHTDLNSANGKLDTMIGNQTSANSTLGTIYSKAAEAVTELGIIQNLTTTQASDVSQIKAHTQDLPGVSTNISAMNSVVQNLGPNVVTIRDTVNTGFGNLHNDLQSIDSNTSGAENRLDQISDYANDIKNKVSDYLPTIKDIYDKLRVDVVGDLNVITNELSQLNGITNLLDTIRAHNQMLTNEVGEVVNSMKGITNILTNIYSATTNIGTNTWRPKMPDGYGDTNWHIAEYAKGASNVLSKMGPINDSITSNSTDVIAGIQGIDAPDESSSPEWIVTIGKWTLDMNPMHNAGFAAVARLVKQILTWVISLLVIIMSYDYLEKKLTAVLQTPGGPTGNTGIGVLNSFVAIAAAAIVLSLLVVLPQVLLGYYAVNYSSMVSSVMSNPLTGFVVSIPHVAGGTFLSHCVYMGLWLIGEVIPIAVIVGNIAIYMNFRIVGLTTYTIVASTLRTMPS